MAPGSRFSDRGGETKSAPANECDYKRSSPYQNDELNNNVAEQFLEH